MLRDFYNIQKNNYSFGISEIYEVEGNDRSSQNSKMIDVSIDKKYQFRNK